MIEIAGYPVFVQPAPAFGNALRHGRGVASLERFTCCCGMSFPSRPTCARHLKKEKFTSTVIADGHGHPANGCGMMPNTTTRPTHCALKAIAHATYDTDAG